MSNRKERAYNATRAHCFYCGCIVNAMNFHLNQPQPGVYVAACPDCARFKGSDDLETFRARLESSPKILFKPALPSNTGMHLPSRRTMLYWNRNTTTTTRSLSILSDTPPTTTASDTVSIPYGYICQNLVLVVVKIILNLILEEET